MAPELAIVFADDGIAIASYGATTITVLAEPSTLPRLARLRRHLEKHRDAHPDGTYSITVLGPDALVHVVPSEIREESTAIARDFPSAGSTIVVEGTGFTAAAIRAFLTGLFLVSRTRSQIHSTVAEAAEWLARRVAPTGGDPLEARDVAAAVEQARAAIR